MQMIDSAPITTYLVVVSVLLALGLLAAVAGLTVALRETRSDRQQRSETVTTYYGRLHFAH